LKLRFFRGGGRCCCCCRSSRISVLFRWGVAAVAVTVVADFLFWFWQGSLWLWVCSVVMQGYTFFGIVCAVCDLEVLVACVYAGIMSEWFLVFRRLYMFPFVFSAAFFREPRVCLSPSR